MVGEIISVGTELLLGNILNTDAQFLSEELSALGIDVYYQTVVGDNPKRLKETVSLALLRSDLIILSGGLGPTDDDLTKETVAECMGLSMFFDEGSLVNMKKYLKQNVSESNLKQAYIPVGAHILENGCGTAPGVLIEKDEKIVVLLPGPPRELKPMFIDSVKPFLKERSPFVMESQILRLFGIGESTVGETVRDLMQNANPTLAPYAKDNETILRITAKAKSVEEAKEMLSKMAEKVRERLGEYIYSYSDTELKNVVCEILSQNDITIASAESCTAGLFAATLCEFSGISQVFSEAAVTYSNEAKIKRLGVSEETLKNYGAVSENTAIEMARGIKNISGADIGISFTGIAGPTGGTEEKPVGLVYIGIAYGEEEKAFKFNLRGDRNKIRHAAVMNGLNIVRNTVLNKSL